MPLFYYLNSTNPSDEITRGVVHCSLQLYVIITSRIRLNRIKRINRKCVGIKMLFYYACISFYSIIFVLTFFILFLGDFSIDKHELTVRQILSPIFTETTIASSYFLAFFFFLELLIKSKLKTKRIGIIYKKYFQSFMGNIYKS